MEDTYLHIVYVTTELATAQNSSGGLATYVANMSKLFYENGHQVTVILVTTKETHLQFIDGVQLVNVFVPKHEWDQISDVAEMSLYNKEKNEKLKNYKTILMNIYKSKLTYQKILSINEQNPIDIIQVTNLGFLSYQFDNKIPYVVRMSSYLNMCDEANKRIPNEDYGIHKMSTINKIYIDLVKTSRFVISPSKLLADISIREYGFKPDVLESPFILNRNDWDDALYNAELANKKYILYFGSLRYLKGIKVLAELVEDILDRYPDMYMVLAGNSDEIELESGLLIQAHEYVIQAAGKNADRVLYVGRPVRELLYPVIKNAEICVLPSRIENLSNACIEAMSMGKIVVATNGASYEQLIEDRVNGILCKRDDSKSFYDGIVYGLELSNSEKEKMSMQAINSLERLKPEKIYKVYEKYYKKVIKMW